MSKIKEKLKETKDRVTIKIHDVVEDTKHAVGNFCHNHSDSIKAIAPIAIPGALAIGRSMLVSKRRKAERKEADCRHYDRRTNETYYSKRKLTEREKDRMIDLCEKYGVNKGEALRMMGLRA